ncbi:hypothetical protein D0861_02048 [Hortaea werneckii]|uniref:Protein root UVB sensitive/RUS domain-containing protein n=1 Tax=Hortaea werneckii TaxID=91943 RepID=A0A3M7FXV1_HORWE|nr:hypothetical protein D0861_02048 [Hortaea werneckii]
MSGKRLEFTEHDEAGNVTATYISSPENSEGLSRVDVILPEKTKSVMLQSGARPKASSPWLRYQIYDSLQAFSSSIAGLLSSRAVLSSVGVGDSSASPTAALLLSILQESAGRIATILFAHRFGTSLEPECKMYRLLADVLNDFAFILDCLSPAFPKPVRIVVLSSSSVLRALCGVAAGSAKASLSAHFARWGNLGELNAKDSSQETVISLMGMLAGSLVVSWVTSQTATWAALILLLSIHLETNRRALRQGRVPKPEDVSSRERIFEKDGILRGAHGETIGWCSFQSSVKSLFECQKLQEHSTTGSFSIDAQSLAKLMKTFEQDRYIINITSAPDESQLRFSIFLKQGATALDCVSAWWRCLAVAEAEKATKGNAAFDAANSSDRHLRLLRDTTVRAIQENYIGDLKAAGWDLEGNALETRSSMRMSTSG